jgi:DNA-binding NarL/FixJ family response regulator
MSGIELISHVRSRYPSVSIVAMSGDYHGDAVLAGIMADRFYPKAEHPHTLLTTIASLIATSPTLVDADEGGIRLELDS